MNKTKNDKYLRKNRYDKNSKHKNKNKTRKVQRGGTKPPQRAPPPPPTALQTPTALKAAAPPPLPPPPPVKAGKALKAAAPPPSPPPPEPTPLPAAPIPTPLPTPLPAAPSPPPPSPPPPEPTPPPAAPLPTPLPTPLPAASAASAPSPPPPTPPPAASAPPPAASVQSQPNNTKDNDIRDLLMQIEALKKNEANENPNPELMDMAKLPMRVVSGWVKDFGKDNQKSLLDSAARNDLIDKMPHIIKINNENFETLSRIEDTIRKNINDIIERNELNMQRKKVQNSDPLQKQDENFNDEDRTKLFELTNQLVYVGELMQKVANLSTQTANAAMTREGNLDGLKSPQGTNGMGFGPNIKKKSKTEALNPEPTDTTNQKTSMFDKGKQRLATMGTATKEGFAKVRTATKEGFAKAGTATKEGFAKMKTNVSNVSNFFTRKKKTEDNSTELTPLAPQTGGGNKTRKNRQYIREIKDNRAHLFKKEMEIINSIRNFKYGHTDEPKKQFIRAVKRS